MWDIGDTVPLGVDIKNSAGTATNAVSITLTITLPDGTATTPSPTNPSTGRYAYDYVATQAGRHTVAWAAVTPTAAYTDTFDVTSGAAGIISVAQAKGRLNIATTDTTYDEAIRDLIGSITDVVENICGSVIRRTVTEIRSGQGEACIDLNYPPVLSITSVTVNGTLLAASDYTLISGRSLIRSSNYGAVAWPCGVGNITIVEVVGLAVVLPAILEAVRELVRINFRPVQGGNYSPYDGGTPDDYGTGAGEWRLGFFVPNRVMQQLQPAARGPMVG